MGDEQIDTGTCRAFVAVRCRPDPATTRLLKDISRMAGNTAKTVSPEQLHITLRFLGDVDPSQLQAIADALQGLTDEINPFQAGFGGLGRFPEQGPLKVIWLAVTPEDHWQALADATKQKCLPWIPADEQDKPFQPHVTLARVKRKPPPALLNWVNQRQAVADEAADFSVNQVELLTSELTPEGAIYQTKASIPLITTN